jgi:hypothetical protein
MGDDHYQIACDQAELPLGELTLIRHVTSPRLGNRLMDPIFARYLLRKTRDLSQLKTLGGNAGID